MGIIANPPSYITAAQFRAMPNDYDLSSYVIPDGGADPLQDLLNRASGIADSIMRRSLLAREETRYYDGAGSAALELDEKPLIYVRQIAFAQPGLGGVLIPTQNLLIDYSAGEVTTFMPILLQGAGYVSRFPNGVQLAVRLAWGYGIALGNPLWTSADVPNAEQDELGVIPLPPGQYDIGVSAATPWGETAPTIQTVMTVTGSIQVTIQSVLGAERYRVYLAPHTSPASQPTLVEEVPSATFGDVPLGTRIITPGPPPNMFPIPMPTIDTSPHQVPFAIQEATRMLALQALYEQNNLANRGIQETRQNGGEMVKWRSTDGTSAQGVGVFMAQATELLRPFKLAAIYT